MTFTVDTCIVIALVNRFDFFHERSKQLLERRVDDLVISFTVLVEAMETYVRKFNEVSVKIIAIYKSALNSPNFAQTFKKDFKALMTCESQKDKNLINFYEYIFSLIEPYIKSREFEEISRELQDHPLDSAILIPARINSIKEIADTIYPKQEIEADRQNIDSILSRIDFPRGPDKNHFIILCVYSRSKKLDYFTTDKRYFLRMTESLNLIRGNELFQNIGLFPQYLTESYIKNLQ